MKFCNKCGDPVEAGEKFCSKCGNLLEEKNISNNSPSNRSQVSVNQPYSLQNSQTQTQQFSENTPPQKTSQYSNIQNPNAQNNKKGILVGVGLGLGMLVVVVFGLIFVNIKNNKYYFNIDSQEKNVPDIEIDNQKTKKKGKYSTAIIYDNKYSGITINSEDDAYDLIVQDSTSQKENCPSEIKSIEDQIIENYGITAVNLCEMDVDFAKEIGKVIQKIYTEYPSARGHITNISLVNAPISDGYIAAFMPTFYFATSDSSTTYPWVIKTQILLNTAYFLNPERMQTSVKSSSEAGHFPPNATMYSPVAHEFGHYLSFLAMIKNYETNSVLLIDENNISTLGKISSDFGTGDYSFEMINEAFNNYKTDNESDISLDEWRGTISQYALAKDNNGNYIYDETIAESFHDVYLNGENAVPASKYIVNVLKEKLES